MMVDRPTELDTALANLRDEIVRTLRLDKLLTWLAGRLPPWVGRLPAVPFWVVAAAILLGHVAIIVAIVATLLWR